VQELIVQIRIDTLIDQQLCFLPMVWVSSLPRVTNPYLR